MEIVDFLNARFDEDEEKINKAHPNWVFERHLDLGESNPHIWVESPRGRESTLDFTSMLLAYGEKVVWDDVRFAYYYRPSRALVELKAKRKLLYIANDEQFTDYTILNLLAAPYWEHRDFRSDWKVNL